MSKKILYLLILSIMPIHPINWSDYKAPAAILTFGAMSALSGTLILSCSNAIDTQIGTLNTVENCLPENSKNQDTKQLEDLSKKRAAWGIGLGILGMTCMVAGITLGIMQDNYNLFGPYKP